MFLDIFLTLISIDSVTGDEGRFCSYLLHYLRQLTKHVQTDSYGNIYARTEGTGEPIFFAAHMDTVEPGKGIQGRLEDGYIVSDGTTILGADNKAAIALYLTMLKELQHKNMAHRPIEFLFTRSEEVGNYGALHFDYSLVQAKHGFCFDSVAPVGTIITASPYYERMDITVTGKEAHASKPEEADNVLPYIAELLHRIPVGRIDQMTLCNIGKVEAGHVRNTIPGGGKLHLEIRSYTEEDLARHKTLLISLVDRLRSNDRIQLDVDSELENPGYYFVDVEADDFIQLIESHMLKHDISPIRVESMAVSDANIFNTKGLMCVNLGDGVEFAHTVRERISVSDMERLLALCISLVS